MMFCVIYTNWKIWNHRRRWDGYNFSNLQKIRKIPTLLYSFKNFHTKFQFSVHAITTLGEFSSKTFYSSSALFIMVVLKNQNIKCRGLFQLNIFQSIKLFLKRGKISRNNYKGGFFWFIYKVPLKVNKIGVCSQFHTVKVADKSLYFERWMDGFCIKTPQKSNILIVK